MAFGGSHKENTAANVRRVEEVFKLILDEMKDEKSTRTMFEPYSSIVRYCLSDARIRAELNQVARDKTSDRPYEQRLRDSGHL
jgi:hypothetical protein